MSPMTATVRAKRTYQMIGWILFVLSLAALLFQFLFRGGQGGTPEIQDYELQQRQR